MDHKLIPLVIVCIVSCGLVINYISYNYAESWTNMNTYNMFFENKTAPESNELCTFRLIRGYIKQHGSYPSGGEWYLDNYPPYYQPAICKLRHPRYPGSKLRSCLEKSKVTSVMTTGDSNANNAAHAIREVLGTCQRTRRESLRKDRFVPNPDYFKLEQYSQENWTQYLRVHYRFCRGCAGHQYLCSLAEERNSSKSDKSHLQMEHLPMTMVLDDTVELLVPEFRFAAMNLKDLWAITSQEVTFRYFLKDRYPDVLLVYLPFNHAKHLTTERVRMDMEYFRSLVRLYFPSTTKLVYMPTFSEFEKKRKDPRWVNVTFDGMLGSDKVNTLNRVMYNVFMDDFVNGSSSTLGFFDLHDISKPMVSWSKDGIHMHKQWYQVVASVFWETFCNSVMLTAF